MTHGGKRARAGRKELPPELLRVKANLRLRRSSLERLDRERRPLGLSRGEYVELLLG